MDCCPFLCHHCVKTLGTANSIFYGQRDLRSDLDVFVVVDGAATGMGCLSSWFYRIESSAAEK
jgi:hypothetical protein